MTPQQVALIKKLVAAERYYWKKMVRDEHPNHEDRMVEVGRINGVNKRTAKSLEELGLVEGWSNANNQWMIRFKVGEE